MSRYILIRRLRAPAFLLLVGVNALLAQAHILGWGHSWPFYLILAGLLLLAERAALAEEGYPLFPGAPWHEAAQETNQAGPSQPSPIQTAQSQGSENSGAIEDPAIGPASQFENHREGGQS